MAARTGAAKAARSRGAKVSKATVERNKRQIPSRLAEIRGDRSQRSFARELGVFQQNVNRYENGTTPHADFLITLALKENVSLDWLLMGRGKSHRRG
jgi:transcriptional regulator with XRE-family HTH domain